VLILPAIDLIDGQCVRLRQGNRSEKVVYSEYPLHVANQWRDAGATWLHVVNLDGAFGESSKNTDVIRDLVSHTDMAIELGGGIRSMADIDFWLSHCHVDRIILGTVAVTEPQIVDQAVQEYGSERIVIGIDARQNRVAIQGWVDQTQIDAIDLALQMKALGICRLVYTDVMRDGELKGANIAATDRIARKSGLKVIASGGISHEKDVQALVAQNNPNIEGAIIGKALYDGKMDLRHIIDSFSK
jgi:phosphoribosylformimino-5-aminoimidazole carboxamide ribotide isomerase